jgi:hypothetical protein
MARGEGELSVDVRRRTVPVADGGTAFLGHALRIAAAAAGILGLALILLGWLRGRGGSDRLPNELWWAGGGGLALTLAPLFLPGDVVMLLIIAAIPILIAGLILRKAAQRQAGPRPGPASSSHGRAWSASGTPER